MMSQAWLGDNMVPLHSKLVSCASQIWSWQGAMWSTQSSLSHKAGFLLCSQWQSIFHTPPLPLSYCQQYCCQHGLAHLQDTLLWLAPVCMCLCFLYFLFFANTDCGISCVFTVFVFNMKYMPPVDNTCLFVVLLSDVQCAHLQNS